MPSLHVSRTNPRSLPLTFCTHTRAKFQGEKSKKLRPNATQNTGWLHPARSVAEHFFCRKCAHWRRVASENRPGSSSARPQKDQARLDLRGSVSGVAPDEDEVGVRVTFRLTS